MSVVGIMKKTVILCTGWIQWRTVDGRSVDSGLPEAY